MQPHLLLFLASLVYSLPQKHNATVLLDDAYDVPPGHEEILFYPGFGRQASSGNWLCRMRGVLLDRSAPLNRVQSGIRGLFKRRYAPNTALEEKRIDARFSYFFADTLGDRYGSISDITSEDGDKVHPLVIGEDGSFEDDDLHLAQPHTSGDVVRFQWTPPSVSASVQSAQQSGRCHLYGHTGFSILTDIDDTVKDTYVPKYSIMFRRAYKEIYRPVTGMPELFQHWERTLATPTAPDVAFHYLSGTPYSLLPSLDRFFQRENFPLGPIHVAKLRLRDPMTILRLTQYVRFKIDEAHRVAAMYPQRKIVLLGDSGQNDAKAYGQLLREDPAGSRYVCAFIRLVTGVDPVREDKLNRREIFEEAFSGVDPRRYYMFTDASELMTVDIANGRCKPQGKADTDIGTFSADSRS